MNTRISCTSMASERGRGSKAGMGAGQEWPKGLRCRVCASKMHICDLTKAQSLALRASWHTLGRLAACLVKVSGCRSYFADSEEQRQMCKQIQWWFSLTFSFVMPDSTLRFFKHLELNSVDTVHFALVQLSLDCHKSLITTARPADNSTAEVIFICKHALQK